MFYRKHDRVTFSCGDQVMTKQSHKAECDIHNILRQYQRTGIIAHVSSVRGEFMDLPDVADFQDALHQVQQASEAFALLPSVVRDHYGNDPGQFLAALGDPAQRQFLEEVGVYRKTALEEPPKAE